MAGGLESLTTAFGGSTSSDTGDRILRTPGQASHIFGLDGARAPRQKNLFVVNFKKAGDSGITSGTTSTSGAVAGGTSASTWTKEMGFLVKSVDRPSVEPKLEELNQYNKKRLIHTGYKVGPTRLVLYDTADSMVMQMWNEYAKYYFGDFRHAQQASTDFQLDTVNATFNDTAGAGFGFAPQSSTSSAAAATSDMQKPFFFDVISVYQVFGGKFVQFDLINPKISSFDPDELDYSNSEVATFTMVIQCEAVIYKNDFQPQSISGDAFLNQAFGQTTYFAGDVVDYPGQIYSATTGGSTTVRSPISATEQSVTSALYGSTGAAALSQQIPLPMYDNSIGTGSLNAYGLYNFGNLSSSLGAPSALSQDLSLLAASNPGIATVLGLGQASTIVPLIQTSPLASSYRTLPASISQDVYDQARAAVQVIGQSVGNLDASTAIGQQVTFGVLTAALAADIDARDQATQPITQQTNLGLGDDALMVPSSPRDQVYNRQTPPQLDSVPPPNTWSSARGRGLSLTPTTYGVINTQRNPYSQIGYNASNDVPYLSQEIPAPTAVNPTGGGAPSAPGMYQHTLTAVDPYNPNQTSNQFTPPNSLYRPVAPARKFV